MQESPCVKLISSDSKNGNKKFWSYIKSKRSDHCGISSLEKNHQVVTDICETQLLELMIKLIHWTVTNKLIYYF